MLIDKTVTGFLAELKSDSPAPGGGSAAALAGAVAAALGIMVGNLTAGSGKYAPVHAEARRLLQELEQELAALERYIDEDTDAFTKVMQSYKLPRNTPEEKLLRGQAVQDALQGAAKLPLSVAQACARVLELSVSMLEIGNVNAASDAAVAGRMAQAAMWSALYNVRINLAAIQDSHFVAAMTEQAAAIIADSEKVMAKLVTMADEKI